MSPDKLAEFKGDIQELQRCLLERWRWLEEFERDAYASGDFKRLALASKALETITTIEQDLSDFEFIALETLALEPDAN
jgi:hypothetical protein